MERDSKSRLTGLEVGATVLSGLVLLFLLAILVWDAVHPNAPPEFSVQTRTPQLVGDSYRAQVRVSNVGDDAARDVVVHIKLAGRDSTLAETNLTIDWLPGRSSREVVGYFPRPAGIRANEIRGIEAAVNGYTAP
jgi:uncharacterized protein (TIGR02588 family)